VPQHNRKNPSDVPGRDYTKRLSAWLGASLREITSGGRIKERVDSEGGAVPLVPAQEELLRESNLRSSGMYLVRRPASAWKLEKKVSKGGGGTKTGLAKVYDTRTIELSPFTGGGPPQGLEGERRGNVETPQGPPTNRARLRPAAGKVLSPCSQKKEGGAGEGQREKSLS